MILKSWETEIMPLSTRTSVLSTIYKADDRKKLLNYRPLSLTNCDYKIAAFVFAERLKTVISKIINPDQSAYIKERYIGCSIRNLIDIYDHCERNNIPGALLCTDFQKAFDSVEHDFMFSVLRKFNFGDNFIKWIQILYTEPIFKVKNNGWISEEYNMGRGIRQGCSVSALIFLLVVEILSTMIRNNCNVKGIIIDNQEHKVIQYADDMTVCVRDQESINYVLNTIDQFSMCSGLKLNVSKTKGIWLGTLKDLGLRTYCNITWTGKPVKCLGIYIGHNQDKCLHLNWYKKLERVEEVLRNWKKRKLTLFGKVEVIKTYALSKLVFPASVLPTPEEVIKRVKILIYYFLWGERDKVKRKTISNSRINGGLGMIDVDVFFTSLKASWVGRIQCSDGKWSDVFKMYLTRIKIPHDYVWKMSFRNIQHFPLLNAIPRFYQDIILAFNKAKHVKPFNMLSTNEIVQLPIWGSEYFKVGITCLYLKSWLTEGILYVKDFINPNGSIMSDDQLFNCIGDKRNVVQDMYIIKRYVIKKFRHLDLSIANSVSIKPITHVVHKNKLHEIAKAKSKLFYEMLMKNATSRGNMESILSRDFNFDNNIDVWKKIYTQKLIVIKIPKLCEFNFKLVHNIVPNGKILSKWKEGISDKCTYCKEVETTKHMLFKCKRVLEIWKIISNILKVDIMWKHITCGFPKYNASKKISCLNYIICIVAYSIFKENSMCKFEKYDYAQSNLLFKLKSNFMYYRMVLNKFDKHVTRDISFRNVCKMLEIP